MGEGTTTYCRSRDLSEDAERDLEREANVFGAGLLMPEAAVRAAWGQIGRGQRESSIRDEVVRTVASTFEVSTSAMWYRLYSFALVPTKPDNGRAGS